MGLKVTVTPTFSDKARQVYEFAGTGLPNAMRRMADLASDVMLDHLRKEAPIGESHSGDQRDAGTFYRSIHASQPLESGHNIHIDFLMESPIAEFIIGGTAAHTIEAAEGHMLAFYGKNGELVFRHKVEHPGTSPDDFVGRAVDTGWPEIIAEGADILRDAVRQAMAA